MKWLKHALCLALLGLCSTTFGAAGCSNSNLISGKLITDICWDCIFPILTAGVPLGGGKAPSDAVKSPLCMCYDNNDVPRPGVPTSMWEPARLIEFERVPGCLSTLGGTRMPFDLTRLGSHSSGGGGSGNSHFTHYHYLAFPVMYMLDMFMKGHCNPDGYLDLDIMYLSELDPTWNDSTLAFFTNPEAAIVANPVAVLACTADAVSSAAGKPIDSMFWCSGAWGNIYPLSGHVTGGDGVIKATSLETTKVLAALSRRGLEWDTMGKNAMCGAKISATLKKSQYKITEVWPVPEAKKAHVIGQPTITWGANRILPGVGEDPIYLLWRWNDCCNTK